MNNKPILNVKKLGGTCIFFVDPSTDRPQSIASIDEECPETLFAFVSTEDGVLQRFSHHYDVRFLEKPPANLPNSVRVKATPADLGIVEAVASIPNESSVVAPNLVKNGFPNNEVTASIANFNIQRNTLNSHANAVPIVLKELEMYLVKLSVAEGKKAKALEQEYSIVRAFCVKLYSDLEIEIVALEETYGR